MSAHNQLLLLLRHNKDTNPKISLVFRNSSWYVITTGPRNSRLHIHMYLHMPCLKMWKTHHRTYFQASALKLMSVQGGSAVGLPAPADKLAPKDVFLQLCSQAQSGILLCWGHTSRGVCPFQDFDTYFFIQPLNCRQKKRAFLKAHVPCFYKPPLPFPSASLSSRREVLLLL